MRTGAFMRFMGIAVVAISISLTASAAETIVNTGPGGNGDPGGGLTLGLDSIGGYQNIAGEFQLLDPTEVGSIFGWIGLDRDDLAGGTLNISILANDPNTGTVEFSQDTTLGAGVDQVPGWTGLSGLDLNLSAGTYWVEIFIPGQKPLRLHALSGCRSPGRICVSKSERGQSLYPQSVRSRRRAN